MNSETIHYANRSSISMLSVIANRIRALFTRRPGQTAPRPENASIRQGELLHGMPLKEKLRLGMYQYMD